MSDFAIIEEEVVTNVILADDISLPRLFFPSALVVEITDTTGPAYIGLGYSETKEKFFQPQPFPSWVLDENSLVWSPPTSQPDDGLTYYWSEPETSWVEANF